MLSSIRTRAALGLRPLLAPAFLLVPLGALLGPEGLEVLSADVLAHLDVVTSVALAVLGIFVGLALGAVRGRDHPLIAAAAIESFATIALVSVPLAWLIHQWGLRIEAPLAVFALLLGLCAAPSAATLEASNRPEAASRIADLDDIVPVGLGAIALSALGTAEEGVWTVTAVTALTAAAVAVAGWLLFERARTGAERTVFVTGSVVLLAGCAAYVSGSPLLAGLVAGVLWVRLPGGADRIMRNDLRALEHPLVILLLVIAGATGVWTAQALWLCAPLLLFRLLGKLGGGCLASRFVPGLRAADLGASLVPPGVLGVALALNVAQVAPAIGGMVVTAVAWTTLCSELAAAVLRGPTEGRAS